MAFFRWIVFSNVWVAFAAPSMLWLTAMVLGEEPHPMWYVFVYASTLFTYNIQRLFKASEYLGPQILGRHRWIWEHRPVLHVLTVLSGCVALVCLFYVPFGFLLWLLPSGFISALYFIPFYRTGGRWKRLRDVPLLKINLVAFTWAWTLVAAPALVFQKPVEGWWALLVFEFFFCFGVTYHHGWSIAKVYGFISGASGDCNTQANFNPNGTSQSGQYSKKVRHRTPVETLTSSGWVKGDMRGINGSSKTKILIFTD